MNKIFHLCMNQLIVLKNLLHTLFHHVTMNRDKKNNFLMIITSYSFNEKSEFVMDWYWTHNTTDKCSDSHHFRLADVDWIHFEFELGFHEIGHGDRFYVGRFNKDDATMMRYGIQQDNPTYLTVIITILHQVK